MSPYFDSYRKQVGADSDSRRGRIFSRREGGGLGEIRGTSFFFFFLVQGGFSNQPMTLFDV
jgi:hypothetical protein